MTKRAHPVTRALVVAVALLLALPATALAQVDEPLPPVPCPWWDCGGGGPVVIEQYRVDTTIDGAIATTRITQVLRNDGRGPAEGRFLMPIPAEAAVTGLTLWIDGEPVAGEVLSGEAARRTYEQIVRDTRDPALLEFVDDGLLSLSVFPIPAGVERTVAVEYRQVLAPDGGLVRYRQPMGREHHGVEIEQIVARIEIIEPDGIKAVHSPTHAIALDRLSSTRAIVGFEGEGRPDGDFVLLYSTDPEAVSVDVVSFKDGEEGWFLLLASPGIAAAETVTAKDVVLVLDVSGSMQGEKLAQARRAAASVLSDLNPDDRFEVLAFSNGIEAFGGRLRPASEAGDARTWVSTLAAGGSTNIHAALTRAASLEETGRPLYVMFMTDGLATEGVIDTADILAAVPRSETTSIFSFGVGFDVDTILLDSLAADHHGATEYVVPGEEIDTAMESLSRKVASPVMTGVRLTVDGVQVADLQPATLPDIFSGGLLVVVGTYTGGGPATVRLSGRIDGEPVALTYDDVVFSTAGGDESVPALWATRTIGSLLRRMRMQGSDPETIEQIVRISIRHGIVTPYTSYLVTEPTPFGEAAVEDIARSAAATATTLAASGEAAVSAADAAARLSATDLGGSTADDLGVVLSAGGRTFRLTEGVWVDTTFDPGMEIIEIGYGTDAYFRLATTSNEAADALAVGTDVLLVIAGVAYAIGPGDASPATIPTTVPGSTTSTTSLAAAPAGQEDGDSSTLPLIIAATLALAGAAVLVTRRRHH